MDPTIATRALAEEMAARYGISRESARHGVEDYLNQLVDLEGGNAAIAARRAERSAAGHWIRDEVTLTAAAADSICGSFADEYDALTLLSRGARLAAVATTAAALSDRRPKRPTLWQRGRGASDSCFNRWTVASS